MKPAAKPRPAKRDTVVVAYCHPGQVSAFFSRSLLLMTAYSYTENARAHIVDVIEEWSSANISSARNDLVKKMLSTDADWLLMVDSDMAWEPQALDRLLESADQADRPIVGGLCFGSFSDMLFPTIYQFTEDSQGRLTTMRMNDYDRDSVVPCAATGAAFLLIHRSVLEVMRDKKFNAAFPWFQETEGGGRPVGEDLTFCIRAAICGFPIHVDTSVKVGHHKSILLTEELFLSQQTDA